MTVLFWVVMGICSFVMIAIGIFAYRKEGPMWFWSGTEEVEKEFITDVKSYNHKQGIMWIIYGISLLFPPFIASIFELSKYVFVLLEVGVLVGGMLGMMLYYEHIHDVYTENNKMNER